MLLEDVGGLQAPDVDAGEYRSLPADGSVDVIAEPESLVKIVCDENNGAAATH